MIIFSYFLVIVITQLLLKYSFLLIKWFIFKLYFIAFIIFLLLLKLKLLQYKQARILLIKVSKVQIFSFLYIIQSLWQALQEYLDYQVHKSSIHIIRLFNFQEHTFILFILQVKLVCVEIISSLSRIAATLWLAIYIRLFNF